VYCGKLSKSNFNAFTRGRHALLPKESQRDILASHEYATGTIAVNVAWSEREFNACQTPRRMYPSIFNRFPVIQSVSLKVRHFSTFFAHFGLPWVHPWDNRGKICYMDRKRIQCLSNASLYSLPIYLQPFLRYSKLLFENCDAFIPHLCLVAPQGVTPLEFREDLEIHKTRMNGLSCGEESMTIICSAVLAQCHACDSRTDGRIDVQPIAITCFSKADARKNHSLKP